MNITEIILPNLDVDVLCHQLNLRISIILSHQLIIQIYNNYSDIIYKD